MPTAPSCREHCAVEDAPLVQGTKALLGVALERDRVVCESRLKLSRLIFADFALRPVGRNVQRQYRSRRDDRPARHHAEVLSLTGDSHRTRASREPLPRTTAPANRASTLRNSLLERLSTRRMAGTTLTLWQPVSLSLTMSG
jgi:hypothetical protein